MYSPARHRISAAADDGSTLARARFRSGMSFNALSGRVDAPEVMRGLTAARGEYEVGSVGRINLSPAKMLARYLLTPRDSRRCAAKVRQPAGDRRMRGIRYIVHATHAEHGRQWNEPTRRTPKS